MKFLTHTTLIILIMTQALQTFAEDVLPPEFPKHPSYYEHGPWHMDGGCGFGLVFGLVILFLIIAFASKLIFFRRCHGHYHGGPCHKMNRPCAPMHGSMYGPHESWVDPTNSALQILNERLAKGEIQIAEYQEKKIAIIS